jgi:cupin 2 domain-containing protein
MIGNLLANLPPTDAGEQFQQLLAVENLRIERIVSRGDASPEGFWYDQHWHEWVLVLQGAARLRFEGEQPLELRAGDHVEIPAHRRHRVDWTAPDEPTIWLAVHYGGATT